MPSPEPAKAGAPGSPTPADAPAATPAVDEPREPTPAAGEAPPPASPADGPPVASQSGPAPARGYARMRAADDAARAGLEPLGADERPLAIKLAVAMAALIGVANIALLVGGWQLSSGQQLDLLQSLAVPVLMLVLALAMWQRRYWALVAFQAILAISIILAFLFLLRASNLEAVVLSGGVLAVCGTLFWFLVRAMARVQMPEDPSR